MDGVKFNFEDLKVYQKALDFADFAYSLTHKFPNSEKYGLSSQFSRAAVSIALNISEGSGDSDPQFHRFLQIAEGSVRESVTCTTIGFRRGFISNEENQKARNLLLEILKMIRSLQIYLKNKKTN
ncbi:four helix bundle protein [Gramella sp. BOM4]|nr:four helix bundle protein [Christiangramia bathymodioli]